MHTVNAWLPLVANANAIAACERMRQNSRRQKTKHWRATTTKMVEREKKRRVRSVRVFFCAILHATRSEHTHTHLCLRWNRLCDAHTKKKKPEWSHIHACDNTPRPGEHITTAFRTHSIHDWWMIANCDSDAAAEATVAAQHTHTHKIQVKVNQCEKLIFTTTTMWWKATDEENRGQAKTMKEMLPRNASGPVDLGNKCNYGIWKNGIVSQTVAIFWPTMSDTHAHRVVVIHFIWPQSRQEFVSQWSNRFRLVSISSRPWKNQWNFSTDWRLSHAHIWLTTVVGDQCSSGNLLINNAHKWIRTERQNDRVVYVGIRKVTDAPMPYRFFVNFSNWKIKFSIFRPFHLISSATE